ncbi:hypothetical protein Mterra_00709 [Calidithermus terrae]|uniref:Uncharacterized protein n=1 Tax=Calidithermus terrae TaxID=1408545 RepID=A0A399EZM1_9DEIN|nr:hypothetical protein [Calidithermus terrae]RIH89984.1 hypothetical protein Mterra_00709 [Calidithermus terrae]
MSRPAPHDDRQLAASLWASAIGLYVVPQWLNAQASVAGLVLAVLALQLAALLRGSPYSRLQLLQIAALIAVTAVGEPVVASLAGLLQPQPRLLPSEVPLIQPYSVLVGAYMLLVTGLFVWGWLRARAGSVEPLPVLGGWAQRIAASVRSD